MSAVPDILYPIVSDWHGCYGESWGSDLVPEAYSHPAKYSRALIRKIYTHASEEGWIRPDSVVVDPFGGIAGGALDAMLRGCHWKGCELESRFVELGRQNIALWNSRHSRMPSWGTAELRQGDSRELASVFQGGELAVSSPPYAGGCQGQGRDLHPERCTGTHVEAFRSGYSCAISSPPYASARIQQAGTGGNEANMRRANDRDPYGATPGQLGGMREGSFDAAITSPPFKENRSNAKHGGRKGVWSEDGINRLKKDYILAVEENSLGKAIGADFWQASRLVLEQLHKILAPNGHAVFVTKRFVRKKQVVEFSGQWAALCEAVGFRQLHHHRCWLVEHHGAQMTLDGELQEVTTERKSFFRRLAEKNGSPRIDYEDVLCFVKPPLFNSDTAAEEVA